MLTSQMYLKMEKTYISFNSCILHTIFSWILSLTHYKAKKKEMSTQRVCLQCNMVTTYLCETRFPAVYSLPDLSHAGASHGGYSKPLLQSLPITPLIPESIRPLACACDASTWD